MSEIITKNLSLVAWLERPPLASLKIQRIFQKIQRKNQIITNFIFLALQTMLKNNLRHMAAFQMSRRFLRYPYWLIYWLHMPYAKCFKNGIYLIFGINDTYSIWIMAFKSKSIWVSKEALGSQEYSHMPLIVFSFTFNAENLKCVIIWFFLCLFGKSLASQWRAFHSR